MVRREARVRRAPTLVLAVAAMSVGACGGAVRAPVLPDSQLELLDASHTGVRSLAARAPYTVFFFFSAHCPCVAAHDARLLALYEAFRERGVQFIAVDSEVSAEPSREAAAAHEHRYPFPLLIDEGGKLADAIGAEYASYTVVVDSRGRVHYAGGIDSDRSHLRDDAQFFVRDALIDLLAGREPRTTEGKALGCALQKS